MTGTFWKNVSEEQGAPMTGGDLQGSGDHGEAPRLSRRDFTRLGAFAGGVVWGAPKVTSIQFANRAIGTPGGPTTTPPTDPPPTTTTSPGSTSTTTTTSSTTTTTTPDSTTSTTINNQGSTTTTEPGGTTTTTEPGGTTTTAPGGTTTTTSDVGPEGTTSPPTVGTTTPSTVTPQSSVPGGPGQGPHNGGNGSGGVLSFTGADSADLAVVGATAIVLGRALYVLGRRPPEEDAIDGVVPPATP
jgi:hypothetical protein